MIAPDPLVIRALLGRGALLWVGTRVLFGFASLLTAGVFDSPSIGVAPLSNAFTIRRHLEIVQRRFGAGSIDDVASITCIADRLDQRPRELSGGELRRAEFAVALLRAPECLLADEPYRGVAPHDAETLSHTFRRLASAGCTVVVTGHEVPTLLDAADHIVWCTAGTTYDLGTPADACADWRFQREYLGSP